MIEKTSVKFTPIVTTFRVIIFTFLIIYSLIFISRTLLIATIPSLKVGASPHKLLGLDEKFSLRAQRSNIFLRSVLPF